MICFIIFYLLGLCGYSSWEKIVRYLHHVMILRDTSASINDKFMNMHPSSVFQQRKGPRNSVNDLMKQNSWSNERSFPTRMRRFVRKHVDMQSFLLCPWCIIYQRRNSDADRNHCFRIRYKSGIGMINSILSNYSFVWFYSCLFLFGLQMMLTNRNLICKIKA